ncbi:MAG: UDP-N-acetylglucosamine 2-epimerase (hydrolyzing) [Alphaproteobacteria bacterium]|nr:MAG: UDP-N-acetylglucosamine 2-epimerase (hydrolyzing) [Alphaproteobacteria bacterium]
MSRTIAVVTGTRAEYGLLSPLMRLLKDDESFDLRVIVTGSHLSKQHGLTYRFIEEDGFDIAAKVDLHLSGDEPGDILGALARATEGIGKVLLEIAPDLVVILGDRYEILGAAQAAMIARIPIAHIHGGEITEGAIDESIRHAITKMAHLHFASTADYARRIRQLGENPAHVFNVGAPGLDNIRTMKLLTRKDLAGSLGFDLGNGFLLVTYHPVTLGDRDEVEALEEMLEALDAFPDLKTIITFPNADTHGQKLANRLKAYAGAHPDRVYLSESLGQLRYLSAMKEAEAVVGNSSSGIIEAPSLGTPTVNIGVRQKGRIAADSVIHCGDNAKEIEKAIAKALTKDFKAIASRCTNPYGSGHASEHIRTVLKTIDLGQFGRKPFFDLSEAE